jgi:hypothetical protein
MLTGWGWGGKLQRKQKSIAFFNSCLQTKTCNKWNVQPAYKITVFSNSWHNWGVGKVLRFIAKVSTLLAKQHCE